MKTVFVRKREGKRPYATHTSRGEHTKFFNERGFGVNCGLDYSGLL
jgi:hypothetical protein